MLKLLEIYRQKPNECMNTEHWIFPPYKEIRLPLNPLCQKLINFGHFVSHKKDFLAILEVMETSFIFILAKKKGNLA